MYTVYLDGEKIFDPRIRELTLIDPVLELTVNDAGVFKFSVPPDHPAREKFTPLTSTIEIYRDEDWIWSGRIIETGGDFLDCDEYECEGALAFLNDTIQSPENYHGISLRAFLERVLKRHNDLVVNPDRHIRVGAVTVSDITENLDYTINYATTLDTIRTVLKDTTSYIKIRKTGDDLCLDVMKELNSRSGQIVDFGENLIDFTKNTDYTDICTGLVPLGAKLEEATDEEKEDGIDEYAERVTLKTGGLHDFDHFQMKDMADIYGYIFKIIIFEGVTDPQELLKKGIDWLQSQQWAQTVFKIKAVDYNYFDADIDGFNIGDEIRVRSEPHHLDKWMMLTKQTIHLDSPLNNSIELGGTGKDVTLTKQTLQLESQTHETEEKTHIPNKLIQEAIDQATDLINEMTHGFVVIEPNEILIMDTPDKETAKNVWRWNSGGLGFSSNGYLGPFETAITMDGHIVGKFLAANSIVAEQLDVEYRNSVTEHIQKTLTDANDYTDSVLGESYYTKSDIETKFQVSEGEILAQAYATGSAYTDAALTNKLADYVTSSSLSITLNGIKSEVMAQVNTVLGESYYTAATIDQKFNSITASVTSVKGKVNDLTGDLEDVTTQVGKLKITCDNILLGVYEYEDDTNTKLSQIQLSIDKITSTVADYKDKNNKRVSSLEQKADSITASVTKLGDNIEDVEAKISEKGIFATIRAGIQGSEKINNTYFSMTKSGFTVMNGGLTVKNKKGSTVFSVNTAGDALMTGAFEQYASSGRASVKIQENNLKIYAWNYDGNLVGGLGSLKGSQNSDYPIVLWSDYGDDLIIGSKPSNSTTTVNEIIRLGSKGSGAFSIDDTTRVGIKYIKGTLAKDTIHCLNGQSYKVRQGLITGKDNSNASRPKIWAGGHIQLGRGYIEVTNGMISAYSALSGYSGQFLLGNGRIDFTNGLCTAFDNNIGITKDIVISGTRINITRGLITAVR